MSGAHSETTFELVHVASNDIRFPLIYRFALSLSLFPQKEYPWIYFVYPRTIIATVDLSLGSILLYHRARCYFKDSLNRWNRISEA